MPKLSAIAAAVKETGKPAGTWSLLIYSAPKQGKTRLAGTIAKVPFIKRVSWFDLENGSDTLDTMVREGTLTQDQAEKIMVYKIPDTKQVPMAMETLMKCLTVRTEHLICNVHGKIDCVICATKKEDGKTVDKITGDLFDIRDHGEEDVIVIDSGSQLGDSILNYYLRGKSQDYKPGWDEYGPQNLVLNDAFSIIQRARTNFIVCTHEVAVTREENDKEVDRYYPLIGTKNFSMKCAKYFTHVAYLEIKLGLHKGGTATDYRKDTITGSRAGWRLEDSKSLDLSVLFEQLRGGIQPAKTKTSQRLTCLTYAILFL